MPDVTLTDSLLVELPDGARRWHSLVEVEGVGTLLHIMPEDALAIRAAEYGFDPDADRDELVEIVLTEIIDPPPPGLHRHPRFLGNNPDRDDARAFLREQRAAHRSRVRTRNRRPTEARPFVPQGARVLLDNDTDPDTPLAMLRRAMPASSETAERVRGQLDALREHLRPRPRR